MNPFDEEALRIFPVYKRYEKLFEPKLPWMPRTGMFLVLSIFGLAFFHLVSNIAWSFWEGMAVSLVLLIAVALLLIWGIIGLFRPKTKTLEMEFREDCTLEKEYCREIKGYSIKARQITSKYLLQYWEIEEARFKAWAGICLTVGGIASTLSDWTGKPKVTYAFLVMAIALAYVWMLIQQISLTKAKRFGEFLKREGE